MEDKAANDPRLHLADSVRNYDLVSGRDALIVAAAALLIDGVVEAGGRAPGGQGRDDRALAAATW